MASRLRKIYFYRWHQLPYDNDPTPPDFLPKRACQLIDKLPFEVGERYQATHTGEHLAVWMENCSQPIKLMFGIRRFEIPILEGKGNFEMVKIQGDQRLVEPTHLVFFENGIVGAEYNFYGPRISRLERYLYVLFPTQLRQIKFEMLLNHDVDRQLKKISRVHEITIAIHRDYSDVLKAGAPSLHKGFESAASYFDAPRIVIEAKQAPRTRKGMGASALEGLKALIGIPNIREAVDQLKVRGLNDETGRVEDFDFLQDRLVAQRSVKLDGESNRVESPSMYTAIQQAYEDLREELEAALGANI